MQKKKFTEQCHANSNSKRWMIESVAAIQCATPGIAALIGFDSREVLDFV